MYCPAALDAKVDANHVEVISHLGRNSAMLQKIYRALNLGGAANNVDVEDQKIPLINSVQLPTTSMKQLMELNKQLQSDKARKESLVRHVCVCVAYGTIIYCLLLREKLFGP